MGIRSTDQNQKQAIKLDIQRSPVKLCGIFLRYRVRDPFKKLKNLKKFHSLKLKQA